MTIEWGKDTVIMLNDCTKLFGRWSLNKNRVKKAIEKLVSPDWTTK